MTRIFDKHTHGRHTVSASERARSSAVGRRRQRPRTARSTPPLDAPTRSAGGVAVSLAYADPAGWRGRGTVRALPEQHQPDRSTEQKLGAGRLHVHAHRPLFVVRSTPTPPDELASAASFVRGETCRFEASLARWSVVAPDAVVSVQPSAGGMTSRDTCAFESNEICACSRGCACGGGALAPTNAGARDRAGILRVAG